jgi:ABC-type Fe3+ transport system substrate-binding protein
MSEEERQRLIDFILSQQAQFAADSQRWREEQQARWKEADKRWAETEKGIRALLAIAEIHDQEIKEQSKQIDAMREAGRETDERLGALINTVERIIDERRNGGPRQN